MINLRYHIVSLTAVFLALIIGILMGTTVVSKATVDGLRSNLHRAEVRSEAVHQRNDELTRQLSQRREIDQATDKALTSQALTPTVEGTLEDVPVLVVASSGASDDLVRRAITSLQSAGANVDGTLILDEHLAPDKLDVEQLGAIVGANGDRVLPTLIRKLANDFASAAGDAGHEDAHETTTTSTPGATATIAPPIPTTRTEQSTTTTSTTLPAPVEPDLISALRRDGYLDFRPVDGQPNNQSVLASPNMQQGIGYRYVFLSGANPSVPDSAILIPLIATLARDGSVPLVAASTPSDENGTDRDVFLGPLLQHKDVKGKVSTVDNLDGYTGMVALAFALRNAGQNHFGNFGVGDTASSVLPPYRL